MVWPGSSWWPCDSGARRSSSRHFRLLPSRGFRRERPGEDLTNLIIVQNLQNLFLNILFQAMNVFSHGESKMTSLSTQISVHTSAVVSSHLNSQSEFFEPSVNFHYNFFIGPGPGLECSDWRSLPIFQTIRALHFSVSSIYTGHCLYAVGLEPATMDNSEMSVVL